MYTHVLCNSLKGILLYSPCCILLAVSVFLFCQYSIFDTESLFGASDGAAGGALPFVDVSTAFAANVLVGRRLRFEEEEGGDDKKKKDNKKLKKCFDIGVGERLLANFLFTSKKLKIYFGG